MAGAYGIRCGDGFVLEVKMSTDRLKKALKGRDFRDQLSVLSLAYYEPDEFKDFCDQNGIDDPAVLDWTETELEKLQTYKPCLGLPQVPETEADVLIVQHWAAYRFDSRCTDGYWSSFIEPMGYERHHVVNVFICNFPILTVSKRINDVLMLHEGFQTGTSERSAWTNGLRAADFMKRSPSFFVNQGEPIGRSPT